MIAVFDSGLGGLTVLKAMLASGESDDLIYIADRANAPYGSRSLEDVRRLTHRHASIAIERGATTFVVACNTGSAASLKTLRAGYPGVDFVGMEPAIKPAAELTRTGTIGVLATEATFQGRLFASLVGDYAASLDLVAETAPDWVVLVEKGEVSGRAVRASVERHVNPLLERGADVLVLGCTHYPLLLPIIEDVVAGRATIVDPSDAVARQAKSIHRSRSRSHSRTALVSGDIAEFSTLSKKLTGISFPGGVLPL